MRVLFDQGTPVPLRNTLAEHSVETAFERNWATLSNGELLTVAETEGFEIFVTTDHDARSVWRGHVGWTMTGPASSRNSLA